MAYAGYGQTAQWQGFGGNMMPPQNYNYPTNGVQNGVSNRQYAPAPMPQQWQQTYQPQVAQASPHQNHHSPTQAQYTHNGHYQQQHSPTQQNGTSGQQQASPPTYQHAAPHNPQNDPDRRPGDWDCPACGALCFASKTACFKCGEPRPASAGRPPSMFKASQIPRRPGDWDCPGCQFMCFASKTECPVCGTKKPIPPLPTHTLPQPTQVYQAQPQINQYAGFITKPANATPAMVVKTAPAMVAQNGMMLQRERVTYSRAAPALVTYASPEPRIQAPPVWS